MEWVGQLQSAQPITHAVLILSAVIASGLALGSAKVRGIGLGIAGILFAGIGFGHLGFTILPEALEFARDFGLVVFVYAVGMQVGPSFFASVRQNGLTLNLLTLAVVVMGAAVTVGLARLLGIDMAAAVGLFSGATTNTPSLGAAQEALRSMPGMDPARVSLPPMGYAIGYPFGIVGIILSMLLFRALFRADPVAEAKEFEQAARGQVKSPVRMNVRVENENLEGLKLEALPGLREWGVIISRIKRAGEAEVRRAHPSDVVHVGDTLLAVGARGDLEQFRLVTGAESAEDLVELPGPVQRQRVVLTSKNVVGKTLAQLALDRRHSVTVSRLTRAGLELVARPDLRLQFGDMLQIVGQRDDIDRAAKELGNSLKELNHTDFIPVFLGIALGVMVGAFPLSFGNMPAPVRLGIAGGPLLVSIILSRIGKIGPLVWHMPVNANAALRDFGICLFLAAVGLKSGQRFFELLFGAEGWLWVVCAAAITLLPLLVVGLAARLILKRNFTEVTGLLAGSMTDPPALAFACAMSNSDGPTVAYATVYPLTVFLRILAAQGIVLFFAGG